MVSSLPIPGTQMGGCGFCSGNSHGFTYLNWKCLPSQLNGPGSVQVRTIRSCDSSKRSRLTTGLRLVAQCSTPIPRTKPEMILPPENRSSIATSSASRTGFSHSAIVLPSSRILHVRVRSVIAGALRTRSKRASLDYLHLGAGYRLGVSVGMRKRHDAVLPAPYDKSWNADAVEAVGKLGIVHVRCPGHDLRHDLTAFVGRALLLGGIFRTELREFRHRFGIVEAQRP